MKKTIGTLILSMSIIVTGCSGVEEVKDNFNYVTEATDFVADVQNFANEIPEMAEKAVTDLNARTQLEDLLTEMKTDIQDFEGLTPPSMIEDIHNQINESNTALENGIDKYLTAIEDGNLSSEILSEIDLLEELSVYTDLLEQIQKLDQ
jgi:PBP1b-binding outer membrane lipoprotein LpoB